MYKEGSFSSLTFFSDGGLSPTLLTDEKQRFEDSSKYVLVFSRNRDMRILLGSMLAMWGFASQSTDDLDNLLTIIKDYPPTMILVDSVLPFDTNLKVIHLIRNIQSTKNIPVAMLSGFSQPDCRRRALDAGANDFFVKPLDFDVLEIFLQENYDGDQR